MDGCARAYDSLYPEIAEAITVSDSQVEHDAPVDNVIQIRRRLGRLSMRQPNGMCRAVSRLADTENLDAVARLKPKQRETLISEMVGRYKDHFYVESEIDQHRSTYRLPEVEISSMRTAITNGMAKFDLLTPSEERSLFERIDNSIAVYNRGVDTKNLSFNDELTILDGVAARQIVYLTNLRYVYKVANEFPELNRIPIEDVVQEGNLGLATAIARFDVSKGFRFLTYADWWIKQKIRAAYADQSRLVRVSREKHDAMLPLNRVFEELAVKLNREPTKEEIASALGMSESDFQSVINATHDAVSIDAYAGKRKQSGEGMQLSEVIADENDVPMEESLFGELDKERINRLVESAGLDDKTRIVLGLSFHIPSLITPGMVYAKQGVAVDYSDILDRIKGGEDLEQREIADALGVHPRGFREIKAKGLLALRDAAFELEKQDYN